MPTRSWPYYRGTRQVLNDAREFMRGVKSSNTPAQRRNCSGEHSRTSARPSIAGANSTLGVVAATRSTSAMVPYGCTRRWSAAIFVLKPSERDPSAPMYCRPVEKPVCRTMSLTSWQRQEAVDTLLRTRACKRFPSSVGPVAEYIYRRSRERKGCRPWAGQKPRRRDAMQTWTTRSRPDAARHTDLR
jgi:hypothetical protein